MTADIDDRFRQLVSELSDTAPEPVAWGDVLDRRTGAVLDDRNRRPLVLVAAGAIVAVGAGLAAVALLENDLGEGSRRAVVDEPSPTTGAPSVALGSDAGMSCVSEYSVGTLVDREFAFDGTVTAIGPTTTERDRRGGYVEVTFHVDEWFVPDGPEQVVVQMFPPGSLTSVGTADYDVGSRLLVTGEPRWGGAALDSPVAWYCGFSRTYDEATATAWREAFAASG